LSTRINLLRSSLSGAKTRVVKNEIANNISGRVLFPKYNSLATYVWNLDFHRHLTIL
jgi:hypothetical protein